MASIKISRMGFLNKGKRKAEAKRILAAFSEASMDLEGCLQQPMEDTTIVGQLTQLRSYIESHTLKFYHSEPLGMIANDTKARFEDEIRRNFQNSTSALISRLVECESREIAIRSTIAHILFASIDFTGDFKRTLLPPKTVSLLSSFKLEARSTAESYESKATPILTRTFGLKVHRSSKAYCNVEMEGLVKFPAVTSGFRGFRLWHKFQGFSAHQQH